MLYLRPDPGAIVQPDHCTSETGRFVTTAIGSLQKSPVQQLAPFVYVDYNPENGLGGPHVVFRGCNVHIVNGLLQTNNPNNLGNLVIGYNESPTTPAIQGQRSGGSHNIIMGTGNRVSTHVTGGIVNGSNNFIDVTSAVILNGSGNQITGNLDPNYSSYGVIISGNGQTLFDAPSSVIVGGGGNYSGYIGDVILGGSGNINGGVYSVVLGGYNNQVVHYTGLDQDIIVPAFNTTNDPVTEFVYPSFRKLAKKELLS